MTRRLAVGCIVFWLAGCNAPAATPDGAAAHAAALDAALAGTGGLAGATVLELTREPLADELAHYTIVLGLGDGANARLRVHRLVRERAPFVPRVGRDAILLNHGDAGSFVLHFAPALGSPASPVSGLAVFLARAGVDVWGLDRRWTQAPAGAADLGDFAGMGVAAELDDIGRALTVARAARALAGRLDRLALAGFSRGGQLAYAYAVAEADRPALARHVKALIPLDVYAVPAPADENERLDLCALAASDQAAVAGGALDSDNSVLVEIGVLDRTRPNDPSPLADGLSNRELFLAAAAGRAHQFTSFFHSSAGIRIDGNFVGLSESDEDAISAWFAGSPPHQALREVAESEALWCGEGTLPVDYRLERIRVPLFYLGMAGGFGEDGVFSTTKVGSSDVTTLVVRRLAPGNERFDFGHQDLLFARDMPALGWQPLLDWLRRH